MRLILYCAISVLMLVGTAGGLARYTGLMPAANTQARPATPVKTAAARTVPDVMYVPRGRDGHFGVDAVIGGRQVPFLVDTGATIVALTAEDAARLGIRPSNRDRIVNMSTANGTVPARMVRLAAINVGPLVVQDVDAAVMPKGALGQNLLGMSFLSRLTRYEFRSGQLVMEQ